MEPTTFPEQTMVIAKHQPQYLPLPAHVDDNDPQGRITFCWKLTWRERIRLLWTGLLWQQVLAFGEPLQPQKLLVYKPWRSLMPPIMTDEIVEKVKMMGERA